MFYTNRILLTLSCFVAATSLLLCGCAGTTIWKVKNPANIGGFETSILGNPQAIAQPLPSVHFGGSRDGIIVPDIPIRNQKQFTIEALFFPDHTGAWDPRFMHLEDSLQNRSTLEIRLTGQRQWYLDAFLKNGKTGKGFALIDSTKLHPADAWYWVALAYDGKNMRSYVNGILQMQQDFDFPGFTEGRLSLGVRLNQVNWFKGNIAELRFHSRAVKPARLKVYPGN